MDDDDDILKIGELSTGWYSHSDVINAAKWLRDSSFTEFLDVVEKLLREFRSLFELICNDECEYSFQRNETGHLLSEMQCSSRIELLYLAWEIARGESKSLNEFNGSLIECLGRSTGNPSESFTAFFKLSDELAKHRARAAIRRTQVPPQSRETKTLPFGLQRCDVEQTLKRQGWQPVTIANEDYWRLMEALMAAAPNAVPEATLQRLFTYPNDRDNAPKKLRNIIDALGLTIKKWTLQELEY